jgi:beta-N-acetylhexosaminidase
MAIMPGHISLAAYDEPDENGIYPPASVSKKLLTDLLRNKLGFEGIIISDATNMSGFCGYMNLYRASCAFLEAGGDCLLFMHESDYFHSEMRKCIEEGYLSLETLKSRAYRMKCFAYEYFEKHPVGKKYDVDRSASDDLAKEITKRAVRITRDRQKLLPISINSDTRIAHITIANSWSGDYGVPENLVNGLHGSTENIDVFTDPGPNKLLEIAKSGNYDLMICSVFEGPAWGINTAKLSGPAARNMMCGWMKYGTPVIFITYNSPAFAKTYEPIVDTVIETHGHTKYTVDALLDLIVKK